MTGERNFDREVRVYFNFRSPYCYLASKSLFQALEPFDVTLAWMPLSGWNGRSPPERAAEKVPLARQDVSRWCARLAIPFVPPPADTDPTNPALISLAALELGLLREFVVMAMHAEWGEGRDIGQPEVLHDIAAQIGMPVAVVEGALCNTAYLDTLAHNWERARTDGVIGVPSFVIGTEVFWGNDRIDFLQDYLASLKLTRT
ncbi:disulfide bond formation protein DsbA [Croceicoccus estronivorus]|uniref:2-hydroxychromene-2-carboxylate isomerase n=1 Tax=Croceicoccus estronivorus TaxID=1172626 RepID=UPI0008331D0E|nr:DsbA family protein [Croceicoccus estronivorus]OCC23728.1 disulfide bond formation protein DsbA [Croceicoccus estronivorus]